MNARNSDARRFCRRMAVQRLFVSALVLGSCLPARLYAQPLPRAGTVALEGVVKSDAKKPVPGAVVVICSARPRDGQALLSNFSHSDCLKYAFTDEAGRFVIDDLDGRLTYNLLVAGDGFGHTLARYVDARERPLEVTSAPPGLKTIAAEENDVWGFVVDPDGKPVPGAIVAPRGYMQGNTGLHGPMEAIAATTVTNAKGRFRIPSTLRVRALHLEVRARGLVPHHFNDVASGQGERVLNLVRGVTVRGRIVHEGRGQSDIAVGACWVNHYSGTWYGPWETVTGGNGRFKLTNLTPDQDLCVYAKMDSVRRLGAPPLVNLSGADTDDLDLGDLRIVPGRRLHGRVAVTGRRPLPPDLRVQVWRDGPVDLALSPVSASGEFEIQNLPDELLKISVRAYVPGTNQAVFPWPFHLSAKNKSLDPHNPQHLLGRLGEVTEIVILLEPGRFEFPPTPDDSQDFERLRAILDRLRTSPIEGIPVDAADK